MWRCKPPATPKPVRKRPAWDGWYSGPLWSKIKAAFRSKYPERAVICQWIENGIPCTRVATHTDHIKPHKGDWFLFCGGIDYANLQGLCARHHSMKTASEDGGFANVKSS